MDYEEYTGWHAYFNMRPYGWRDDLRAFYVMSSLSGGKAKPEDVFPSIAKLKAGETKRSEEKDRGTARMQQTLRASVFGNLLNQSGIE